MSNKFHFKKSRYDRPAAPKVCGLAKEGRACDLGPGPDGECPGRRQCHPLKNGDRWECSRPQSSGGKCSGPTPEGICPHRVHCVPDNAPRHSRKKWGLFFLALTAAVFILLLSTPAKYQLISPGELSAKHGGINNNQCSDCHNDGIHQPLLMLPLAFSSTDTIDSNAKCLDCHSMGPQASLAHSVSSQTLQRLKLALDGDVNHSTSDELACVACHREHNGSHGLLTEVNPQQCDSCHQRDSAPFESAHPQFDHYGQKPQVVAFNHNKHFNQHFEKINDPLVTPQACSDCHISNNSEMSLLAFEQSCSGCHSKDVASSKLDQPGIALLSLPTLDLDTLTARGIQIGEWPSEVEDGELAALSLLGIATNQRLDNLIARVQNGTVDLSDLENATPQDIALVGELAWSLKDWINTLSTQGHSALAEIYHQQLNVAPVSKPSKQLIAGLPQALINQAQQLWFPSLKTEMAQYHQQQLAVTRAINVDPQNQQVARMSEGGWYLQDYSLRYRPIGHADNFMSQWLNTSHSKIDNQSTARIIHGVLTDKDAPGQCAKCHQSLNPSDSKTLAWTRLTGNDQAKTFTRFKHAPHLALDQGNSNSCNQCHKSGTQEDFLQIEKQQCSGCHTESLAGNDCLLCHNYHIDQASVLSLDSAWQQMIPSP